MQRGQKKKSAQGPSGKSRKVRRPRQRRSMDPPGSGAGHPVYAPVATAMTRLTGNMFRFGAAAPHDDFPEGGLRISGRIVNTLSDTAIAPTTGTGVLGNVTTGGGGGVFAVVSPSSWLTGTWPFPSAIGGTTVGFLYAGSRYFRRYRFRKLCLIYEGACSTTTAGSVQMAYDSDAASAFNNASGGAPSQSTMATSRAVRFPVWTPSAVLECIGEKKHDGADYLYQISSGAITTTLANSADARTLFQGAYSAVTDVSGPLLLGHFAWEFVLDLYGFTNTVADVPSLLFNDKKEDSRRHAEELKAESSDSELVDLHPASMKRASVHPLQDQGLTPANTPAGSKNSVRSLSLK